MIGFFGYDLAPRFERLPRRLPRNSRLPDIRMALYDTAITVDVRSGKVELWAWDLTGEGRSAAARRCRAWQRPSIAPFAAPSRKPGRSELPVWDDCRARSTARRIWRRCAGCWNTSPPATSFRLISPSASRPMGGPSRWIFICGSGP